VLVNAAEAEHAGALHETAEEDWDRVMGVNLKGLFLLSRQVLPVMMRAGGGVVVNLGCGGPPPQGSHAAYAASKGGVVQLTRLMASDYARNNIRVNCLCPGLARSGPNGRPGAQQIAHAILFLASEEASFITGVVLPVDGGSAAR
jgi:dihydroanticapsin dehydrogenase